MGAVVYLLCALASLLAAGLLVRGYLRSRVRLLFWSSLCFVFLAANNVLLFIDLVLVQDVSLSIPRASTALAGVLVLLYGLIWDLEAPR